MHNQTLVVVWTIGIVVCIHCWLQELGGGKHPEHPLNHASSVALLSLEDTRYVTDTMNLLCDHVYEHVKLPLSVLVPTVQCFLLGLAADTPDLITGNVRE